MSVFDALDHGSAASGFQCPGCGHDEASIITRWALPQIEMECCFCRRAFAIEVSAGVRKPA